MADHREGPREPSQLAKLIVNIAAGKMEGRAPTIRLFSQGSAFCASAGALGASFIGIATARRAS